MVQNFTDEQRVSELVDNCHRAVHDSLADIQKAIVLLESSIESGETREKLPETLEEVQTLLGEVIVEFQNLDRQIQDTIENPSSRGNWSEINKLQSIFSSRLPKPNLDKTA
jgi:DNA anti-recombination protein RmuC